MTPPQLQRLSIGNRAPNLATAIPRFPSLPSMVWRCRIYSYEWTVFACPVDNLHTLQMAGDTRIVHTYKRWFQNGTLTISNAAPVVSSSLHHHRHTDLKDGGHTGSPTRGLSMEHKFNQAQPKHSQDIKPDHLPKQRLASHSKHCTLYPLIGSRRSGHL